MDGAAPQIRKALQRIAAQKQTLQVFQIIRLQGVAGKDMLQPEIKARYNSGRGINSGLFAKVAAGLQKIEKYRSNCRTTESRIY